MKKKGEILSMILFLIMGIALIGLSVRPPQVLVFFRGNAWRAGSAMVGIFFLMAGTVNIFHRKR